MDEDEKRIKALAGIVLLGIDFGVATGMSVTESLAVGNGLYKALLALGATALELDAAMSYVMAHR